MKTLDLIFEIGKSFGFDRDLTVLVSFVKQIKRGKEKKEWQREHWCLIQHQFS